VGAGAQLPGQSEPHRSPSQGMLFTQDVPALEEGVGYRGPTACGAAGVTYRQLDYWARTGLVEPSVRNPSGSLQQIRVAVTQLRESGVEDLANITLMSDGASVYACTSDDEVIDLVRGGQGVFGIAVGSVWREVEGQLAQLPSERAEEAQAAHDDELSARRRARKSS
jgi:hypothetical protein